MALSKYSISDFPKYRNSLMGIAILWIMLYHFGVESNTVLTKPFRIISAFGYTGVDIFMFLSGLGLTYSMSRNDDVVDFFKKRFTRIYPIYVLLVIFGCLISTNDPFPTILWKCTALGYWSNGVFYDWYTPAILTCYLAFPVIYKVTDKRKYLLELLIFVSLALTLLVAFFGVIDWEHFALLYRVPIFLLGVYVAKCIMGGGKSCYTAIALIGLPLACLFYVLPSYNPQWLSTVFASPFLLMLFTKVSKLTLLNKFLGQLGNASFEIYLFHISIRYLPLVLSLKEWNHNVSTFILILVSIIVGISLNKIFNNILCKFT